MSALNNSLLLGQEGGGGYAISRSIRFNSSDSAYLYRAPASAGNRKTWTWAGWVKRSAISSGSYMDLFTALTGANDFTEIRYHFNANDDALMLSHVVGGVGYYVYSSNVFRDPSSWYHVVVAVDTTQSTSTNRVKIYVNGVQVTQNTSGGYPAQNSDTSVNATAEHRHGSINTYGRYFDGYLADIHFIDGQALDPTSFGEFSATTGVWMPKAYTGTYGTNGFKLDFADNSSNTATTLGKDTSGNGNNWTPNNLSVTAGAGNDSLVDVPVNGAQTDTGVGGEVRGNYCTWNPLDQGGSITLANGNLDVTTPSSGLPAIRGTVAVSSGKWYFEHYVQSGATSIGILKVTDSVAGFLGGTSGGYSYYSEGAGYTKKINNNVQTDYGASFVAGDTIGVAFDLDAGTITFYKNGSSQGQAFSGLSGTFAPAVSDGTTVAGIVGYTNFGQRPFAYTAPSGYKALCTANLPAPVVTKPNTVFDVKLYTGNGSTQTISGLGFSPDFVWTKTRSQANNNFLFDSVRGVGNWLISDLTNAETYSANTLTSFNSDGFTTGSNNDTNGSGRTFVAWTWDAGSSTVTNTAGSISSQVRANASAGFSICTMTTPSSGGFSFGHELGVAPQLVFFKFRNVSSNWYTYHQAIGQKYILLNGTGAAATNEFTTSPTSTIFTYPASLVVGPNEPIVAYCFAPVAGYSSMGSYVGNGSSDGPFVYTGFRPRWVMIKRSDSASASYGWFILDTARNTYNVMNTWLAADSSAADGADIICDTLSNGFKIRTTAGNINTNAGTFVYACFAESPFQYARAR